MPIYQFECSTCKEGFERYLSLRGEENPPCECGGKTERVWALGNTHIGASTFPFVTKNISGKPIEVTSQRHMDSLCKQYGVVNRSDNAWLEKRHIGSDRAGKPLYAEASGRGLPGSWI